MTRPGQFISIVSIDRKRERVQKKPTACACCGMLTDHPREFHPYAACLMFKSCHEADVVRANLHFVAGIPSSAR